MPDIDAYVQHKNYMSFQHKRPDYTEAITLSLNLAKKNIKNKDVVVGDFCCGTGDNTKKFAHQQHGLQKAILIDINKGFLEIAKSSSIKAKELVILHDNILNVTFEKECDIVFSIFAYHHIQDKNKIDYVNQIKKCLKKGGILILTEIFFDNKKQCLEYYDDLYESIPINCRVQGLKEFLKQTAESNDFEFKVSKKFSDSQFKENGFKLMEEIKVWPKNNNSHLGTFVQVYTH
jgi:ubiquinone/menaquinone biosynthesis C-methylase UbiE